MTKPRSVAATANDNSIPGSRIEDGTISSSKLEGPIPGSLLEDGTITQGKLDPSVSFPIPDGSIINAKISPAAAIESTKLSYTPNFSGGVQRDVRDRLDDYVNVLDFGADPTGVADSRPMILAALATGKSVYFPAGEYYISNTINLTIASNGKTIFGDGRATVIRRGGTQDIRRAHFFFQTDALEAITIKDFYFTFDPTFNARCCIDATGGRQIRIFNIGGRDTRFGTFYMRDCSKFSSFFIDGLYVERNGRALSTASANMTPGSLVAKNIAGYEIPGLVVDISGGHAVIENLYAFRCGAEVMKKGGNSPGAFIVTENIYAWDCYYDGFLTATQEFTSSNDFRLDETIVGSSSGATATVHARSEISLQLVNIIGAFLPGETVTGSVSGASITVASVGGPSGGVVITLTASSNPWFDHWTIKNMFVNKTYGVPISLPSGGFVNIENVYIEETTAPFLRLTSCSGSVKNYTVLQGGADSNGNGALIEGTSSRGLTIDGLTVASSSATRALTDIGGGSVSYINCRFYSTCSRQIRISNRSQVSIMNCQFLGLSGTAFEIQSSCKNSIISHVRYAGTAPLVSDSTAVQTDVRAIVV